MKTNGKHLCLFVYSLSKQKSLHVKYKSIIHIKDLLSLNRYADLVGVTTVETLNNKITVYNFHIHIVNVLVCIM